MRLKNLFTVPTGQKVTEKALRRVLISSVCSILLCMTCLVSTTWAWFAVSIENTGNVIQIGKPEINLLLDGSALNSDDKLSGTKTVQIEHANDPDDLNKKSTLYVTLTIQHSSETVTFYTTLNQENQYQTEITIKADSEFSLSWEASWFPPANATALTGDTITLPAGDSAEDPTTESTPMDVPSDVPGNDSGPGETDSTTVTTEATTE